MKRKMSGPVSAFAAAVFLSACGAGKGSVAGSGGRSGRDAGAGDGRDAVGTGGSIATGGSGGAIGTAGSGAGSGGSSTGSGGIAAGTGGTNPDAGIGGSPIGTGGRSSETGGRTATGGTPGVGGLSGTGGASVGTGGATPGTGGAGGAGCTSKVALGNGHRCAIRSDGSLWCWGWNSLGQVGDGTTIDRTGPVQVVGLGTGVTQVALGFNHTCARKTDDTVWCWGANALGQLGDRTTTWRSSPVQIDAPGASMVQVAVGENHTCAIKNDGTLWCWGHNLNGQLGDGTTTNKYIPTQVGAFNLGTLATEVALGNFHSCARKTDGTLWCWGYNPYGALGDGTTTQRFTPVQVSTLGTSVTQVALSGVHTCARTGSGPLWCWGSNRAGELGDGTTTDRYSPVQVGGLGVPATQVALAGLHTCARGNDGSAWCWGTNAFGQLGDGSQTDRYSPVRIVGLGTSVTQVAVGARDTCAVRSDGSLWCWGANAFGEIGDGSNMNKVNPVRVGLPCP